MPTSPPQKTPGVFCDFLQIRNICGRADVGIGPYGYLFFNKQSRRHMPAALGGSEVIILFELGGMGNLAQLGAFGALGLDEVLQQNFGEDSAGS